jgi:hypothetical protein
VLPSEGRDVREEIVRNNDTPGMPVLDGAVEVDGVPVDDRGGDEAQAGCPEALILEGPITDFALAVEEDRTAQGVAGLTLFEAGMAALAQLGIGQPCRVNRVRSIRPSARKARDRVLPAPAALRAFAMDAQKTRQSRSPVPRSGGKTFS